MIRCDTCPYCKDTYPDKLDRDGYHFCICGMTGNIVYTTPHKIKRVTGSGYIHCGISSCGIFESFEDVWKKMTEPQQRHWKERHA